MATTKPTTKPKNDTKDVRERRQEPHFDYKDFKTLQRYINPYGQIDSRRRTGLTIRQQNQLAKAIKRARHIALLPFSNR